MTNLTIIGGGFAGLWAALAAARLSAIRDAGLSITLLSKDNFLELRPRLYESNPESLRVDMLEPLTAVGVELSTFTVTEIDLARKTIVGEAAGKITERSYDKLVLAAGSALPWPQTPGFQEFGFHVDNYAGAIRLDKHLSRLAQHAGTASKRTITIVGAGFTGIELATEMRERLAAHSNREAASQYRIILIDQAPVVGATLGEGPRDLINGALNAANVETILRTTIKSVTATTIELADDEIIETATVIWCGGPRASSLAVQLTPDCDQLGRAIVDRDLRVRGCDDAFAAGDCAHALVDDVNPSVMSCQHAITMGKFAGHNAAASLLGEPLIPYAQPSYVTCLDLGASGAVFTRGWDRRPEVTGADAKGIKQMINGQLIYPPTGTREEILAAAEPVAASL
jgi:NADH dehydrogenase